MLTPPSGEVSPAPALGAGPAAGPRVTPAPTEGTRQMEGWECETHRPPRLTWSLTSGSRPPRLGQKRPSCQRGAGRGPSLGERGAGWSYPGQESPH